ncbi:MAG: DUF2795 domain-containing protein [Methanoculleus sp.]
MVEAKFKVSPIVVERYLAGVNYPASRQNLIDQAKKNEADKDVMDTIANLPDQTYHSPIDISKAMAGEEVSPGTRCRGRNGDQRCRCAEVSPGHRLSRRQRGSYQPGADEQCTQ